MNQFLKHTTWSNKILVGLHFLMLFMVVSNILPILLYHLITFIAVPLSGWHTILAILLSLGLTTYIWKTYPPQMDASDWLFFLFLIPFMFLIYYLGHTPMLYQAQDPGAYMQKALNMINFGTTYRDVGYLYELENYNPLNGYRSMLRGAKIDGNHLNVDFFYGPALNYFHFNKISPAYYLSITPFAILSSFMYAFMMVLKAFAIKKEVQLVAIALLILSPVMMFFGRTSFSEPISGLLIMFYCYVLSKEDTFLKFALMALIALIAYLLRLDLMLIGLATAVLLGLRDWKYVLLFVILYFVMHQTIPEDSIYLRRITAANPILRIPVILSLFTVGGVGAFVLNKYNLVQQLLRTKILNYVIGFLCILVVFFIFMDDLQQLLGYLGISDIQLVSMKTYPTKIKFLNVEAMGLCITLVITFLGLYGCYRLFAEEKERVDLFAFLFLFFLLTIALFYNIRNSAGLYWAVRRFLPINMPILMLGMAYLLAHYGKSSKKMVLYACAILAVSQFVDAMPKPEYQELERDTKVVFEEVDRNQRLIYFARRAKAYSPILNNWKGELIAIGGNNCSFCNYVEEGDYLISPEPMTALTDSILYFDLTYSKMKSISYRAAALPKGQKISSSIVYLNVLYRKNCDILDEAAYLCNTYRKEKDNFISEKVLNEQLLKSINNE